VATKQLNLNDWLSALGMLNEVAAEATPERDADLLRSFYDLFCASPLTRYSLSAMIDEVELEQLLAANAFESAVLRIISPFMGFMCSRPPGLESSAIASVWLPDNEEEISADGSTVASAFVVAASTALLDTYARKGIAWGPSRTH